MEVFRIKELTAFTLAEVLVTLGIIGVVSSMTLPTLMKNHQRKVYVTQMHKVYNEMQQAAETLINENNAVSLLETPYRNNPAAILSQSFKTVKTCTTTPTDSLADSYKNMNGANVSTDLFNGTACASIASGAVICLHASSGNNSISFDDGNGHVINWDGNGYDMLVDTNGTQAPNIIGRDVFYMFLTPQGNVIPNDADAKVQELMSVWCEATGWPNDGDCNYETQGLNTETYPPINCQSTTSLMSGSTAACFGNLLNDNWEMNY